MNSPVPLDLGDQPLGATPLHDGVAFAVTSANADLITVCLFDERGERETARRALKRVGNDLHTGFVGGIGPGTRYGLRADGPYAPLAGHRFDPSKLLVDPYAVAIDRPFTYRDELAAPRAAAIDSAPFTPKAIVTQRTQRKPRTLPPRPPGFIYELSVRAFSKKHPAIPAPLRGTLAALAEPVLIDHLKTLGVDTVELMPVAAAIDEAHLARRGLRNAWRYNPVLFMAADPWLAPGGMGELREAVAALHAADIAVVVDVVFNHTGESDASGPTLSLRGLDNALYYRHEADGRLVDHSGCGNTLACDRGPVIRLILDALRHWVEAAGVDGFRFDLATVLGRDATDFSPQAPLLQAIRSDPLLGPLTLIAEPWDLGPGGHRVGAFGPPFHEWSDRFRDDVRRFWRGDAWTLGNLATRFAGSSDLFSHRVPSAGINFIAAHDGFTLADLVSHNTKHNEANGEQNRDGSNSNISWNHGVEGTSSDAKIGARRRADTRALLACLFASRGTPMLTAGDEFGRSQGGNNNAYAQDNDITWLDWDNADRDLFAFAAALVALRRAHPSLSADRFLTGLAAPGATLPDVVWLAADGAPMTLGDWNTAGARVLAMALYDAASDDRMAIWVNGGVDPVAAFAPPPRPGRDWRLALSSGAGATLDRTLCRLPGRSVTFLEEALAMPADGKAI